MELFIAACRCLWQNWAWRCCRPKDTIKTWVEEKSSALQQRCVGAVLAEERWHICSLKSQLQPGNPSQLQSQSSALTGTDRRAALCARLHFSAVLQSEARMVQLCLFTDSHTLILKHGRAINSVAAALICSLRGDCIRTMPSSGCSREEREEREERRKKENDKSPSTSSRCGSGDGDTAAHRREHSRDTTCRSILFNITSSWRHWHTWSFHLIITVFLLQVKLQHVVCHRFNKSNTNTWLLWTSLHRHASRFLFCWSKRINKLSELGAEAQHTVCLTLKPELKVWKSKSSYLVWRIWINEVPALSVTIKTRSQTWISFTPGNILFTR